MNAQKAVDKVLHEVLDEINIGLESPLKKRIKEEEIKLDKQKGLETLMKRKEELEKEIEEKEKEVRELKLEIGRKEEHIDLEDAKEKYNLSDELFSYIRKTHSSYYKIKETIIEAYVNLKGSTVLENYINYLQLNKSVLRQFSLASTVKEKRQIIYGLQCQDWREVGVNVPDTPNLSQFKIEEGKLVLPNEPFLLPRYSNEVILEA